MRSIQRRTPHHIRFCGCAICSNQRVSAPRACFASLREGPEETGGPRQWMITRLECSAWLGPGFSACPGRSAGQNAPKRENAESGQWPDRFFSLLGSFWPAAPPRLRRGGQLDRSARDPRRVHVKFAAFSTENATAKASNACGRRRNRRAQRARSAVRPPDVRGKFPANSIDNRPAADHYRPFRSSPWLPRRAICPPHCSKRPPQRPRSRKPGETPANRPPSPNASRRQKSLDHNP